MTKKANAAIHYNQENYSTSGPKLMGKGSANESFFKAFVEHGQDINDFYCYSPTRKDFTHFTNNVQQIIQGKNRKDVTQRWISTNRQQSFAEVGCFYIPAPQIAQFAWTRRQFDQRSYSLCGLTHTISSEGVMGLLEDTIIAPTQAWDAIICTSQVVKKSINNLVDHYTEYMHRRFGGAKFELPIQLPVIPLGVDCQYYTLTDSRKARALSLRHKLGIKDDDIVVLFVGRLSMHAKAHPTPMYLALEEAAKRTDKKIHMLESGWFDNDGQKEAFLNGAKAMAPSINHIVVDGRSLEVRDIIYHACDIFSSLSDNIQETFGLTPLEAMAASKPVVVTDWNGYRDTVRHGEDGFTIPTLAPTPGLSLDLGQRFETQQDTYDHYIGNACQVTSVDIAKCADAYAQLFNNPDLRHKMGASGRQRSENIYDWKHIIHRYQELWAELGDIRNGGAVESAKRSPEQPSNPLFNDPFATFDSYPTACLSQDDKVTLLPNIDEERFNMLRKLSLNKFCMLISEDEQLTIFRYLQQYGQVTVREIIANFDESKHDLISRSVIWFAKIGVASIGEHNVTKP